MKRIIYKPIDITPHILRSCESFQHPTSGARFQLQLNTLTDEYIIFDEVANLEVKREHIPPPKQFTEKTRYHKLKTAAKEMLLLLGVDGFEKEERLNRRK